MPNKKVIALIVLTVLAVISLIYGVTASPKSRVKDISVSEGRAVTPSSSVIPIRRRAGRSQFKSWKKSPFVSNKVKPAAPKLVLSGIIWNNTKPRAMIGSAIVVKGDTIGENKVVEIKQDRVILNDGAKDFELKMEK
ncbi:MAG: hypothetical protein Q8O01_06355 [Candidatus Omnitrophota bacterium]|nr:hypothetical protein [Candidatus Omnitrophota bacterium]